MLITRATGAGGKPRAGLLQEHAELLALIRDAGIDRARLRAILGLDPETLPAGEDNRIHRYSDGPCSGRCPAGTGYPSRGQKWTAGAGTTSPFGITQCLSRRPAAPFTSMPQAGSACGCPCAPAEALHELAGDGCAGTALVPVTDPVLVGHPPGEAARGRG